MVPTKDKVKEGQGGAAVPPLLKNKPRSSGSSPLISSEVLVSLQFWFPSCCAALLCVRVLNIFWKGQDKMTAFRSWLIFFYKIPISGTTPFHWLFKFFLKIPTFETNQIAAARSCAPKIGIQFLPFQKVKRSLQTANCKSIYAYKGSNSLHEKRFY